MSKTQKINARDVFISKTVGAGKSIEATQSGGASNGKIKKYAHSGTPVTQEEFLDRVHKANKDIIVLDEYVSAKTKVRCRCARCGEEWESYPEVLYKTKQCKKCGESYQRNRDRFLAQMADRHPAIEVVGEYVHSKAKIKCKCRVCGYEFEVSSNWALRGIGCAKCVGKAKRTREDLINELKTKNPTVELIGEYVNTQVLTEWKCTCCGLRFHNTPSHILQGQACPECKKQKIGDALRKPHDVFVKEMSERMPTLTITGIYKNCATKIACHCNVCGADFEALPTNLRKQEGCRQCGLRKLAEINRKPHEQFIAEIGAINNRIRVVGQYRGDAIKIECECLECSRCWPVLPSNLLKGSGCPHCARTQTSFMEQAILLALEHTLPQGDVLHRDRTMIGKELDIYIKSLNTAIEPGSYAFHRRGIEKDVAKYNLCREKGIRLITIYDMFNGDRSSLEFNNEDLWTYTINLGDRNRNQELIGCIKRIFETLGLAYDFSAEEERQLLIDAKLSASRKKTSDVIQELAEIHKDIELLSHYEDTKTKMKCRCKKCGREFESNYDHLIRRKQGCSVCNSSKKALVNLDTGEVFESTVAAGKQLGLTPNAIGHACRGLIKKCNGHHWAYLSSLTESQIADLRTKFPDTFKY